MSDGITKEDLFKFGRQLADAFQKMLQGTGVAQKADVQPEWLKSRAVRKMLDISAGSLQNLRVTGQIRYKKVLGSYYYNRADLMNLFNENGKDKDRR
jgi:hypothetical protein